MTLVGLSPSVLYHFRVHSTSSSSGPAVSGDATFTTPSPGGHIALEQNGQIVIEAEHYNSRIPRGGDDWQLSADRAGFSANGYLTAGPNDGDSPDTGYLTTSPELVYQVQVTTPGTYYVWVRGLADGNSDDSVHAGLDGAGPGTADRIDGFQSADWVWTRDTMDGVPATLQIASAGVHTFHLWMREDGLRVDKIILRRDASATPPINAGPSAYSALPRTMCVGDSITRGSGDTDGFSYRDHLQARLDIGTSSFVGTYQSPGSNTTTDVDHEGIGGNQTADVLARLPDALNTHLFTPNPSGSRVLLHIGTNDIRAELSVSGTVDRVEQIIDMIDAHDPGLAVHVALVVPHRFPDVDADLTSYNSALRTRLQQLQASKPNLFIVDMNAAFKQNPGWSTQYLADEVHPSDAGYRVMAEQWQASIDSEP
jgi:lysophospholipase L1-like esterase